MAETKPENRASKKDNLQDGGPFPSGERYYFGTPEEVNNRIATGYPESRNPGKNPPAFQQIGPTVTGQNLNNPTLEDRSGAIKFSGGIPETKA